LDVFAHLIKAFKGVRILVLGVPEFDVLEESECDEVEGIVRPLVHPVDRAAAHQSRELLENKRTFENGSFFKWSNMQTVSLFVFKNKLI
jgi:hypothetical protein